MSDFVRFPHSMVVTRNIVTEYPPSSTTTDVLSGSCNAQVGTGGSTKNENEAMIYDWVIYYPKELSDPVKVNDLVEIDVYGVKYNATVERSHQAKLTNRIWCNNVSN